LSDPIAAQATGTKVDITSPAAVKVPTVSDPVVAEQVATREGGMMTALLGMVAPATGISPVIITIDNDGWLLEHIGVIRMRARRAFGDIVEIGSRLVDAVTASGTSMATEAGGHG